MATIEVGGISRQASLVLLPDAAAGDYVLVHAGFAISLVDKQEALETLQLMSELLAEFEGRPADGEAPTGGA
jgi:hydrogenase expression/formation protein HypC